MDMVSKLVNFQHKNGGVILSYTTKAAYFQTYERDDLRLQATCFIQILGSYSPHAPQITFYTTARFSQLSFTNR